ncbi:MAG: hypothetical protein U0271_16910 [Polyangiaceae bacterium]
MRALAALALVAALTATVGAAADDSAPADRSAEAAFSKGEEAFARSDFVPAAQAFEEAYRLQPHPIALWNAALSWDRAGEAVRAANLYRRFLREAPTETPNRDLATQALATVSPRVARIEVVVSRASAVHIDGQAVEASDGVVFVSPGDHIVDAVVDGESRVEHVTVEAGQTRTVAFDATPKKTVDPEPVKPVPSPPKRGGVHPALFGVAAGLTAVSGALLIWSGLDTLDAYETYVDLSLAQRIRAYPDDKAKQDRTNALIGTTGGLALATLVIGVFFTDFGGGALVGLGPNEVRVVVAF